MKDLTPAECKKQSPSSRRAWIEIAQRSSQPFWRGVALLAEGVDRNNSSYSASRAALMVALLAEGVDRNGNLMVVNEKVADVALLAEGVDRNS